jgi:hypothetical protein
MKGNNIGKYVNIFRCCPNGPKDFGSKKYLIYGSMEETLIKKALSIPTKKFIEDFSNFVNGSKPKINLMSAWEIKDSKGNYLFYECTFSVLRCWTTYFGGNAQIDPYELDMYKKSIEDKTTLGFPIKITSDNMDNLESQKNMVLMLKRYVTFLENY